jgi:hypothetical protein
MAVRPEQDGGRGHRCPSSRPAPARLPSPQGRSHLHGLAELGHSALAELPADAVLFTDDFSAFQAMRWVQSHRGVRTDVRVVSEYLLVFPWYLESLGPDLPGQALALTRAAAGLPILARVLARACAAVQRLALRVPHRTSFRRPAQTGQLPRWQDPRPRTGAAGALQYFELALEYSRTTPLPREQGHRVFLLARA